MLLSLQGKLNEQQEEESCEG
jgi:hypothetical protein